MEEIDHLQPLRVVFPQNYHHVSLTRVVRETFSSHELLGKHELLVKTNHVSLTRVVREKRVVEEKQTYASLTRVAREGVRLSMEEVDHLQPLRAVLL